MRIITNSAEETFNLGKKLAEKLKIPSTLFIEGPLGSGKTTLIRGILSHFGYEIIRSPSFLYIYEYPIPDGKIYHLDLFRVEIKDLQSKLNLDEIIDENAIFLVEWPEKIVNIEFPNIRNIKIKIIDENKREIIYDLSDSSNRH